MILEAVCLMCVHLVQFVTDSSVKNHDTTVTIGRGILDFAVTG